MSFGEIRANWLCKLGLHKWRYRGESVVVTWTEPSQGIASTRSRYRGMPVLRWPRGSRRVLMERRCLRCGIMMKRRLVNNPDGTLSCIGWEPLSEYENEIDERPGHMVRQDF